VIPIVGDAAPSPLPAVSTPDGGGLLLPAVDASTPVGPEQCGNGLDDDGNAFVDDGCDCVPGTTQSCFGGSRSADGVGTCARGSQRCDGAGEFGRWSACAGDVRPAADVCGDAVDQDCSGVADDGAGCTCNVGESRSCYTGPADAEGIGICRSGTERCVATPTGSSYDTCVGAVLPAEEQCEDGLDNDCDGEIDEDCPVVVDVAIDIDGDCVTASCPSEAPFPVGCSITLAGGDERGCVASFPLSPVVYFQEGDACGAGHVSGTLRCSSEASIGLNALTCPINKPTRFYPVTRAGCPETDG
jgi:hypothetical protein